MNRRLLLLAALALGGCATLPRRPPVAARAGPLAELEPLYSAQAGEDALVIAVVSHGCTTKADFTFYVERRGGTAALAFARRHVEGCRAPLAGAVELAFTWAELGLDPRTPVFLLNPLLGRLAMGG